ncbi:hypothetical protein ACFL1H_04545 [Nanoarchaeota archaeon]
MNKNIILLDGIYDQHLGLDAYRLPDQMDEPKFIRSMFEAKIFLETNAYDTLLVVPTETLFPSLKILLGQVDSFMKFAMEKTNVGIYTAATQEMVDFDFKFKKGLHYDVYFDRMYGDLKELEKLIYGEQK